MSTLFEGQSAGLIEHGVGTKSRRHVDLPAKRIRALLIEPDITDVLSVRDALAKTLTTTLELESVFSVAEGIARLEIGGIDAVIMGLDEYRTVHRQFPTVPLIILTEAVNEKRAIQSLREGAQDLLFKQQIDGTLLDRMLRYGIERHERRQLEKKMRATETELRLAAGIQRRLLPTTRPAAPGFDFGGAFNSAFATCGDWYDYVSMRDGRFGIIIGDVSGKGMGPAMVATEARAIVRSLLIHSSDIGEILTDCNRLLLNDLSESRFVTMFFAIVDPADRTMTYVGAGHRAFLFNSAGEHRILESTCVPLGFDEQLSVAASGKMTLQPGDVLIALTDGVEEATAADGSAFGTARVLDAVRQTRCESAQSIADRIIFETVTEFTRDTVQDDDSTAVVLKVKEV